MARETRQFTCVCCDKLRPLSQAATFDECRLHIPQWRGFLQITVAGKICYDCIEEFEVRIRPWIRQTIDRRQNPTNANRPENAVADPVAKSDSGPQDKTS